MCRSKKYYGKCDANYNVASQHRGDQMELNLRTVLVVLGSLVMLGILFDGFRRMRRARQDALSLDVKGDFKFPEDTFSSELPNGGARVVDDVDAEELLEDAKKFRDQLDGLSGMSALDKMEENAQNELSADIQNSLHEERVYSGEPDFQHDSYQLDHDELESEPVFQSAQEEGLATALVKEDALIPKAKPLDLDEHVPLLMDVEELGEEVEPQVQEHQHSDQKEANDTVTEDIELTSDDIAGIEASVAGIASMLSPRFDQSQWTEDVSEPAPVLAHEQEQAREQEQIPSDDYGQDDGRQEAADMMAQAAYAPVKKPGPNAESLADRPEASLVLVTHVVPHDADGFCGEDILYLINSCDLRHGEKEIFHRFEQENGDGSVQFSMANSFSPGVFNPETLLHERIHGLSLFMSLPGPKKAMDAFEAMTEMASVIARNLGGDVHDETHSIMALQTIEHNRQQVRDYVRKQRLTGKK